MGDSMLRVMKLLQEKPGRSMAEAGRELRLSRERVRQIVRDLDLYHLSARHRKAPRITLVCEVCGTEYPMLKSAYEWRKAHVGTPRFCSGSCRGKVLSKKYGFGSGHTRVKANETEEV